MEAACAELSPRPNQQFEVGVFCGSYVTPVEDDYFEHLDRIRGKSKKLKILESAREAVAGGFAGVKELQIAANGAHVTYNGEVAPLSPTGAPFRQTAKADGQGLEVEEHEPRERMDIALHNFRDYARR